MPTVFDKMHGAGNDFVLLDYRQSGEEMKPDLARRLADRRFGVGCDQVLVLKTSDIEGCAARYEVFNADGSPAGQCGNGVRCIALYLKHQGAFDHAEDSDAPSSTLGLEGPAGVVQVRACAQDAFECAMGEPRFGLEDIPVDMAHAANGDGGTLQIEIDGRELTLGVVSMGNPHAVLVVDDISAAPVDQLGPRIGRHPAFPQGCNVGFAQVVDRENIRLRVFERGTGETLACGSGACAAVAVLSAEGRVSDTVNVFLPGGHLVIKWSGSGRTMTMKGPAAHVFRGTLDE